MTQRTFGCVKATPARQFLQARPAPGSKISPFLTAFWGRTGKAVMADRQTIQMQFETLASYRHCLERICSNWATFLEQRASRLQRHPLIGEPTEEVTIGILEDLLTEVLGWPLAEVNHEVDRADIVLTDHGIRRLIIEAKRPRRLAWNDRAVEMALQQARGYATEQKVDHIAISDGIMLYAADLAEGALLDRLFVSLEKPEPPEDLWWLTMQGIWRERPQRSSLRLLPRMDSPSCSGQPLPNERGVVIHPKYKLPATCFAYVGNPLDTKSWKLPYLLSDGSVDRRRLPGAIGAILSNYRGTKVGGIPEEAIPKVLEQLGRAAMQCGRLSPDVVRLPPVYEELRKALDQLGIVLEP